jgi:hypothetical protein
VGPIDGVSATAMATAGALHAMAAFIHCITRRQALRASLSWVRAPYARHYAMGN